MVPLSASTCLPFWGLRPVRPELFLYWENRDWCNFTQHCEASLRSCAAQWVGGKWQQEELCVVAGRNGRVRGAEYVLRAAEKKAYFFMCMYFTKKNTALLKKTWGYWWTASRTWISNVPSQLTKPSVSWAASKAVWSAECRRWSRLSALCCWVLCPDVEFPVQERHRPVSVLTKEGHKNFPRDGTPPLWEQPESAGDVQPGEERRLQGDLIVA